jgi:MFS family permease
VLFGILFVVPFYLESALQLSAAQAGLCLGALPLGVATAAPWAGRLGDVAGPRAVTVGGLVACGAGLVALAACATVPIGCLLSLLVVGVGIGSFNAANNASVMSSAPVGSAGVVGGMLNLGRGVGTSLGVAVTALAFAAGAGVGSESRAIPAALARHGFEVALGVLLGVTAVAALLAARTPRGHV